MTDTNRPEAVHDVLRDMRQWKGDYSVFADRIERALSARASAGEGGAECGESLARNEAFNLADTVIEHMQCGREYEARAAIMEAFTAPQPAQAGASGGGVPCPTCGAPTDRVERGAIESYGDTRHYEYTYRQAIAAAPQPQAPAQECEDCKWNPGLCEIHSCPHSKRCDCIGVCKYGFAGNGATPPAHGDGEEVRNAMLQLFDLAQDVHQKMPEAGEQMIELLRIIRTTRPTPEADARDAARYRYIRGANGADDKGFFVCHGTLYGSRIPAAAELDAAIDAALALPAQGYESNEIELEITDYVATFQLSKNQEISLTYTTIRPTNDNWGTTQSEPEFYYNGVSISRSQLPRAITAEIIAELIATADIVSRRIDWQTV